MTATAGPATIVGVRGSIVALGIALGWTAGCFSDPPGIENGSTTGTPTCPVGSSGCPCTGGGTCDGSLECHRASGLCFDPECTLGSENCPCADGLCLQGLLCVDDYCAAPSSDTTGVAETGSPGTTGVQPMTGEVDTAGPTTLTDSADVSTLTETTTLAETGGLTCSDCTSIAQNSTCAADNTACKNDDPCSQHLDCVLGGQTPDACCKTWGSTQAWVDLAACIDTTCEPVCGSWQCS